MTKRTDTCAEADLITSELELLNQRAALLDQINESRSDRRILASDGDAETIQKAQDAYRAASAKVARLEAEKKAAETSQRGLDSRLQAGDETVTVDEMVSAEKAIARLCTLLKPAKTDLQRAERALTPLTADQYLAHLAADVIESVTDVPVILRRKPENAPEVSPSVILSQVSATDSYGTLDASGVVKVTEVGETGIDWRAVKAAFEEMGSEVQISKTQVTFHRAAWPMPRLSVPDPHALADLMSTFGQAFRAQVSGGSEAQRLVEAGYSAGRVRSVWSGLFKRCSETLEVASPGECVGEATFLCAIQHERGESAGLNEIKGDLDSLVKTFQHEAIGGWSEAGEITGIELTEVSEYRGNGTPWQSNEVVHLLGSGQWPYTVEARVRVTYAYEPAEEV